MTGKKSFQCHKFLPFGNTIFSHQTEKLPFNIKNLQSSLQSHWLLLLALRSDPHRHTTIPALLKGAAASRTLPYLLCYKKKKKKRCAGWCQVCEHRPHKWMSGAHAALMKSVSDSLDRTKHTSGLTGAISYGSDSVYVCDT